MQASECQKRNSKKDYIQINKKVFCKEYKSMRTLKIHH